MTCSCIKSIKKSKQKSQTSKNYLGHFFCDSVNWLVVKHLSTFCEFLGFNSELTHQF